MGLWMDVVIHACPIVLAFRFPNTTNLGPLPHQSTGFSGATRQSGSLMPITHGAGRWFREAPLAAQLTYLLSNGINKFHTDRSFKHLTRFFSFNVAFDNHHRSYYAVSDVEKKNIPLLNAGTHDQFQLRGTRVQDKKEI